ncbi:MAG: threonine synthase, partial [Thermoplasmata archaeon]
MNGTGSLLASLECRACCSEVDPARVVGTCPTCGHALLATYDLRKLDAHQWWERLSSRVTSLWRYRELLPVQQSDQVVTLGEGFTPVLPLAEVPAARGIRLLLKDDGGLPTGSFKARGMSVAVSRARELGLRRLFVPSAGNAGVALSAYGARAGLAVRVYLPQRTPPSMKEGCAEYGSEVIEVAGTIREAGVEARERERMGAFDMSTLREPYRVEGKKTMGLEIVEQLRGEDFPDAIVYPTGGGTGLIGMYKAFQELKAVGLLTEGLPRLYSVQPEGCAPIVRALREEALRATPWEDPFTIAPGLLVPAPFASERILEAVRGSKGGGVRVTDSEIVRAMRALATTHGVSASPEGAATYAALGTLVRDRAIHSGETILLYNTGNGLPFRVSDLERAVG